MTVSQECSVAWQDPKCNAIKWVKKLGSISLASSPYDSSVLIDGAGEMASSMAAALKTGVAAVDYCLRIWLRAYAFAGEAGRAVPMQVGRI